MTAIVVHGGAGAWVIGSERLRDAVAGCAEAAAAGAALLAQGASALDAVEAAVRVLEDCPALNAGRGSLPTTAGTIELDAMIMDGRALGLGAVAAVRRVRNPVSLARLVMTRTPHTLLVGEGAERFAEAQGFPRCDEAELIVPRAAPAGVDTVSDTVGAVALDAAGDVAAATSTGGVPGKMPGRVGDSPLAGAGAYVDNAGAAVSATGDGEALMKLVISKRVSDLVEGGRSPQDACAEAFRALLARFPAAHGGLIALDARGRIGAICNTAAMPVAHALGAASVVARERPE